MPIQLFCSYSHADDALRRELEKHLDPLRREQLVQLWSDRRIGPGEDWAGEIDTHLERADIILLLVSSDFLASDYCMDIELRRALERHSRGEASVIPVILRPVDWQSSCLGSLQALPPNAEPISR
ncbi:MAG TPA: toll/interleukin-1 receptor domain-containing protein, partial [Bryobacteraceae bacterium]|nr:toll/interleukin-1 receptor domain-containing protein [Bryobacteraceae bacterium]